MFTQLRGSSDHDQVFEDGRLREPPRDAGHHETARAAVTPVTSGHYRARRMELCHSFEHKAILYHGRTASGGLGLM